MLIIKTSNNFFIYIVIKLCPKILISSCVLVSIIFVPCQGEWESRWYNHVDLRLISHCTYLDWCKTRKISSLLLKMIWNNGIIETLLPGIPVSPCWMTLCWITIVLMIFPSTLDSFFSKYVENFSWGKFRNYLKHLSMFWENSLNFEETFRQSKEKK